METGPKLNPDVLCVLLLFRAKPVGLTADNWKMSLQISVYENERCLTFLVTQGDSSHSKHRQQDCGMVHVDGTI